MKDIRPEVFRAYDLRGVVDADFDPEWAERLGRAVGTYFRRKGMTAAVTGRDCRGELPGIRGPARGRDAVGRVDGPPWAWFPRRFCYFAVSTWAARPGVMVTATTTRRECNGFKVWAGESTIHTDEIAACTPSWPGEISRPAKGLASVHDILPPIWTRSPGTSAWTVRFRWWWTAATARPA